MTKFRWHKGGYAESMATVYPCNSMDELYYIINSAGIFGHITVTDYLVHDERNGWDTYLVCVDGKAVGFTDGK